MMNTRETIDKVLKDLDINRKQYSQLIRVTKVSSHLKMINDHIEEIEEIVDNLEKFLSYSPIN